MGRKRKVAPPVEKLHATTKSNVGTGTHFERFLHL
jgi:hypothetical protein